MPNATGSLGKDKHTEVGRYCETEIGVDRTHTWMQSQNGIGRFFPMDGITGYGLRLGPIGNQQRGRADGEPVVKRGPPLRGECRRKQQEQDEIAHGPMILVAGIRRQRMETEGMEKLIKIALPPGLHRSGTKYQSANRWYDSHLVRFHEDAIRPIGGWVLQTDANGVQIQTTGKPRGAWSWRKSDSSAWLATGTQAKLYAFSGSTLTLTDITPVGLTTGTQDGSTLGGGLGYGIGGYGLGGYGGYGGNIIVDADTWSLDNFGEILLACLTSDGKIYESTPTAQATQVTNSPTGCRAVCVTSERFVFALGASSDPRNVAWSDKSNRTVWTPAAGNQAGSFPLQTTGRLVAGRRTTRETLLWTDADLWSAAFLGGALVYAFRQLGDNCGLIGPNAYTIMRDTAYWMSKGQFFIYSGVVREAPCEVADYVFTDINLTQKAKIACVPFDKWGEVWWFYPSASQSGLENDRYVMVNALGHWAVGKLGRAAGSGTGAFSQPMLWDTNGLLYAHETGTDKGGQVPYIETGPLELGDGDRVVLVQSLLPDELNAGDLTVQFFSSYQPETPETASNVYQLTARTDVRVMGRQHRLRFAENNIITGVTMDSGVVTMDASLTMDSAPAGGVDWRLGQFRAGVIPGGYR
jgi:hypothetical protein